MKFMFWNTHKNRKINATICDIVWEHNINIIILAEYDDDMSMLINQLESNNIYMGQYFTKGCDRIVILGDLSDVTPGIQAEKYSIQIIQDKYILCAMHLISQIYSGNSEKRRILIQSIKTEIENLEKKLKTDYTILTGDLNEDPYDDGCLIASNFHGLPCKNDAKRGFRTIEKHSFSMFYNPMWNFFGDYTSPPGTYYYDGSQPRDSFWHIFDQVLIRPSLIKYFEEKSLEIITSTNSYSLLDKNGRPDKTYSDHLPIVFEIKEDKNG